MANYMNIRCIRIVCRDSETQLQVTDNINVIDPSYRGSYSQCINM